jgi:excisionase family DNA binding protein
MTDISTIPQLLTIDQLAERLGITVRHVRRLVANKQVPYYKVGKLVRFDPNEITGWLRTRRVPGPGQHDETVPSPRYADRVRRQRIPRRLGA